MMSGTIIVDEKLSAREQIKQLVAETPLYAIETLLMKYAGKELMNSWSNGELNWNGEPRLWTEILNLLRTRIQEILQVKELFEEKEK
jgi:hypothetical protein